MTQGSVTKAEPGTRIEKGEQDVMAGSTDFSTGIHLNVTSPTKRTNFMIRFQWLIFDKC
jgi:hypothetical protein